MQELQAMNIQMRIITEDNIDQLTNLSYQSRNLDKLLHIDHGEDGTLERDINEIVDNYKNSLTTKLRHVDNQTLPWVNAKNENPQLFGADSEEASETTRVDLAKYMQTIDNQPKNLGYYGENPNPNGQPKSYKLDANESDPGSPAYVPGLPAYAPGPTPIVPGSTPIVPGSTPIVPGSTPIVPGSPPIVPGSPPSSEPIEKSPIIGSNIFPDDPQMNAAFNQLGGSSQATILQMEGGQRQIVMGQIMRQSINNSLQQNGPSNTPLAPYFEALPVQKQLTALQGGYNAMSKEFNQLAGAVHNSKITISKPQSVQQQLAGKLPLLSIEKEKEKEKEQEQEQEQKGGSPKNSTLSSNSSIKKISFM
jgi:hypothetical protein